MQGTQVAVIQYETWRSDSVKKLIKQKLQSGLLSQTNSHPDPSEKEEKSANLPQTNRPLVVYVTFETFQ